MTIFIEHHVNYKMLQLSLQDDKKEVIGEVMNGDYKNGSLLGTLSEEEIKELFL